MLSTKLTKKQIAAEKKLKIIKKNKEERINQKLSGVINSPFAEAARLLNDERKKKNPSKKQKKSVQFVEDDNAKLNVSENLEVEKKDIKQPPIKGILKSIPDSSVEKKKRKSAEIVTENDVVPKKKKKVDKSVKDIKTDEVATVTSAASEKNKSDSFQKDSTSKKNITVQKPVEKKKKALTILNDITKLEVGAVQKSPKEKKTSIKSPLPKRTTSTKKRTELISLSGRKKPVGKANSSKVSCESVENENKEESSAAMDIKTADVAEALETSNIEKGVNADKKKKLRSKRLTRKKFSLQLKKLKRKPEKQQQEPSNRGVCYFSHLPHGFYEKQLLAYCSQFGKVTGVYHPVSKKGNSKGFAFVEFRHKEVAEVVADTMNNYLMFNRLLKCQYVPPEKQKPWVFKRDSNVKEIADEKRKIALNDRMKTLTKDEEKKRIAKRLSKIRALQKKLPYEIQVYDGSDMKKEAPKAKN